MKQVKNVIGWLAALLYIFTFGMFYVWLVTVFFICCEWFHIESLLLRFVLIVAIGIVLHTIHYLARKHKLERKRMRENKDQ